MKPGKKKNSKSYAAAAARRLAEAAAAAYDLLLFFFPVLILLFLLVLEVNDETTEVYLVVDAIIEWGPPLVVSAYCSLRHGRGWRRRP